MDAISVETHALQTLAQRMARTRDEVGAAERLVAADVATGAAGPATRALADFDDHWRYGVKRIIANLDAAHDALAQAAAAYDRVEQAIARAAAGG